LLVDEHLGHEPVSARAGRQTPPSLDVVARGRFRDGHRSVGYAFYAMLAYKPGFAVEFNLAITFLSLAVSVVMMTTGFATALFSDGKKGIVAGGAMLGIGHCLHALPWHGRAG
jgi:hypothetical protein